MDLDTRRKLVAKYKEGYQAVADALLGATDAELDAKPAPGKWSAREIVHHLADSEMTSAVRMRNVIATDNVAIVGYDQEVFARRLYYDRPIAASLAAIKGARESTGELLDRLSETEWKREGTHTEHGRYGMDTWLEIYSAHAHDHADQIRRARTSAKKG
jgi:hypothetical protein